MIKQGLFVCLLMINGLLSAQTTMHLHYKNGTKTDVSISDLDSITFDKETSEKIKIATYNVGRLSFGVKHDSNVTENNFDESLDLYRLILKKLDADILFCDEYNDLFCANYKGMKIYTKDVLFSDYPVNYIGEDVDESSKYNISLFSRKVIKNITKGYIEGDYKRYFLMGELEINNMKVIVFNYHFPHIENDNDSTTLARIGQIITLLEDFDYVILCGDFNMLASKDHFKVLTDAGYTLANCGRYGDFATYYTKVGTLWNPCVDNIATKGFNISNVRMIDITGASDHYPFACDLLMLDY